MNAQDDANDALQRLVDALPLQLTDDQKTLVADAICDFTRELLSAVYDKYHVVSKY